MQVEDEVKELRKRLDERDAERARWEYNREKEKFTNARAFAFFFGGVAGVSSLIISSLGNPLGVTVIALSGLLGAFFTKSALTHSKRLHELEVVYQEKREDVRSIQAAKIQGKATGKAIAENINKKFEEAEVKWADSISEERLSDKDKVVGIG